MDNFDIKDYRIDNKETFKIKRQTPKSKTFTARKKNMSKC